MVALVQQSTVVVTSNGSAVNTVGLTGVAAGNCLVVTGSIYKDDLSTSITGVSDGNAYTVRTATFDNTVTFRQTQFVAYLVNVAGGSHTATISVSGTAAGLYAVCGMAEFSGIATSSPEDAFDGNDDQSITASYLTAGPITTTDAGALLIGSAGITPDSATSLAWASPTSWTNLFRQNNGWDTGTGHDSAFWLPGSIQTTYTPQWTHRFISTFEGSAVVVALKAAAGGSTQAPRSMHQFQM